MEKVFRELKIETNFNVRDTLDYPAHIHEDIEIAYVYKGGCTAFCEGKKYILKEGEFFISFPNQIHYYENSEIGRYYLTIFKPNLLLQYASVFDDRIPQNPVFTCENTDDILKIIDMTLCNNDRDMQSNLVTILFGMLMRGFALAERSLTRDSVSNVINYCAANFKEDISVASVASALNISKSYVTYIFGHYLLINFREYINTLRITEAMRLIESENFNITKICNLVGFNTLRTFNRAFYVKNRMTPSEYKKLMKSKK